MVVDDPTCFTIATGERQLLFGSSLLFTPAPAGTYIHVRYQPDRPGRHAATLYVETPYQTSTVRLTGRTTGLLPPALHRTPTAERHPSPALLPAGPVGEPAGNTRRWLPSQPKAGPASADGQRRVRVTDSAKEPTAAERSAKRRTLPPSQPIEESDLEQELNRKPRGN